MIAPTLTVARSWHDDWIVNVLLSDGRLYAFVTEMWAEWMAVPLERVYTGNYTEADWRPIVAEAERRALTLGAEDAEPFCVELDAERPLAELRAAVDASCRFMDMPMFRRLMRV